MTKKRTSGPGRGQEEFDGDIRDAFGAAVRAERARRQAEAARARRGTTGTTGGRPQGPLRPFAVGWRVVREGVTQALGRSVLWASSEQSVRVRAVRLCKEAGVRPEGFEIRYIKEIT